MKTIQKYFYLILCTVFLIVIAIYVSTKADVSLPRFCISSQYEPSVKEISIFDAQDGNYYVFLPSYADMEQVTIALTSDHVFALDDTNLSNGMNCGEFNLGTPYRFAVNNRQIATLWFYQSSNVATMYIDTITGSMDYIHEDKNHEENASVRLFTKDGTIDFKDPNVTLRGRGNSTWECEKKPYLLRLSAEEDVLGMGAAADWILLANALDETNLRNKLVFDLAERVGMEWTPENAFVDVYLNGQYSGLYLLTEKVEASNNRLDIITEKGDFLCKTDKRWQSLNNPFMTNSGRITEIGSPKFLSQEERDRVVTLVNQMEQIIFSGENLSNEPSFDLDSWARKYLIDEITANTDADSLSSYFYYSDGVFYAGPLWDYDLSFGYLRNRQTAREFTAYQPDTPDVQTAPYYRALYGNESFYQRFTLLYQTEFLPILEEMINGGINRTAADIALAAQMNSLRWKTMFESMQDWNATVGQTADGLCSYLADKVAFLSSAWIDNVEYCTIHFKLSPDESYGKVWVKKNTVLETDFANIENSIWIIESTGEAFDSSKPIVADLTLICQTQETAEASWMASLVMRDVVTILSILLLLFLLVYLSIIDVIQRRKERVIIDE